MKRLATCALVVLTIVVGIGCQRGPSLGELVQQAALLEGVRNSRHSRLREEFRQVELSGGLPGAFLRTELEEDSNAAAGLVQLIEPRAAERLGEECAGLLAALAIDESAAGLGEEAATIAKQHAAIVAEVARLADRPACDFGIDVRQGRFGDFRFLMQAQMAARLMLVDSLGQQEVSLAKGIDQWERAWQWIDWLVESRYLEAWLSGAELRLEALGVVERLANDSRATKADLSRMRQVIERSFATWPSTESALKRERAIDLHTYEAIRLGLVEMLFTTQERGELRVEGVLEELCNLPPERIDADQAAYLAYMRKVIELARQPHYSVRKELAEEDRLLGVHGSKADYAWFAIRLCSENLSAAMAEMAADRARVEGWVVALAAAGGGGPAKVKLNPATGGPYPVERVEGHVIVRIADRRLADPIVRIPMQ